MRWNRRVVTERPPYPKLVPIPGTLEEVREMLPSLRESDPEAEAVDGGTRGVYIRVHNEVAETAAKLHGESRAFPTA
jgi:hypothetical protein